MSDSSNLPQSISHKKLSFLMMNAPKDKSNDFKNNIKNSEQDAFNTQIKDFENISKQLLKKISSINEDNLEGKSKKAIMALGALEVHLNMAFQALNAYKND